MKLPRTHPRAVAPQSRRMLTECGDTSVISRTREGCEPVRPCDGQMYTQKTEVSTVPLVGLLKAPAVGGGRLTVKGDFFYPKNSTHCWLVPWPDGPSGLFCMGGGGLGDPGSRADTRS